VSDRAPGRTAVRRHWPGAVLLAIEDDRQRRRAAEALRRYDCRIDTVATAWDWLRHALAHRYDAAVISRRWPDADGLEVVSRLRHVNGSLPIVVLVDVGSTEDWILVRDVGADECVATGAPGDELAATIRAVIRRSNTPGNLVAIGTGSLDVTSHVVYRPDAGTVRVTAREAALLQALATRPGRIVSQEELRRRVCDLTTDSSIIQTYVSAVRRKLGPDVVRTVRGRGYQIGDIVPATGPTRRRARAPIVDRSDDPVA
jgi:two-component system response regulator QseB